jgi:hypothetical protein
MAGIPQVKLIDSTFAQSNALGLSGDREGEYPQLMRWDRTPGEARVKVWTDLRLHEAKDSQCWRKVGLLVESPAYSNYDDIPEGDFDVILTHNKDLLDKGSPYSFYPLGGSRIKDWGMFEKTWLVSVIVGAKKDTVGQRLRHQVAERFDVARFGEPYTDYMPSKVPILHPYRYSIVIENVREDFYWTEKLIDAFSQGCCPIYWGCPSLGRFFDPDGFIEFDSIETLAEILEGISVEDYESRKGAIRRNMDIARGYACAEDWIMRHYKWLLQ